MWRERAEQKRKREKWEVSKEEGLELEAEKIERGWTISVRKLIRNSIIAESGWPVGTRSVARLVSWSTCFGVQFAQPHRKLGMVTNQTYTHLYVTLAHMLGLFATPKALTAARTASKLEKRETNPLEGYFVFRRMAKFSA